MRIACRECWLEHEASFDCWEKAGPVPDEELRRRKDALYAAHAADSEAGSYAEAWRWVQKAGVPYDAIAALRGRPDDTVALQTARKFNRDREAMFLLLLGPTGVGKTVAAALAAVDFASKWDWNGQMTGTNLEPLRYVYAASLTRLSAYDTDEKRLVDELRSCRLLILEDAGDEGTELGRGVLVELLMARHAARRRTVLTGNLRPEAFRLRYGAAVADRIRSAGLVPDLFGEKSKRKRLGQVVPLRSP